MTVDLFELQDPKDLFSEIQSTIVEYHDQPTSRLLLFLVFSLNHLREWIAESTHKHVKAKIDLKVLVRFGLCISPDEQPTMGIADKALRALDPTAGKSDRDAAARASHRARILNQAIIGPAIPRQSIYPGFGPHEGVDEHEHVAILVSASSLERLAEKVVRGLTYLEEGRFIDDSYEIEHFVVDEAGAKEFRVALDRFGTTHERLPGLKIRRAVIPEDRVSAIFEIEVWDQLKLYVTVTPKKLATEGLSRNALDR